MHCLAVVFPQAILQQQGFATFGVRSKQRRIAIKLELLARSFTGQIWDQGVCESLPSVPGKYLFIFEIVPFPLAYSKPRCQQRFLPVGVWRMKVRRPIAAIE